MHKAVSLWCLYKVMSDKVSLFPNTTYTQVRIPTKKELTLILKIQPNSVWWLDLDRTTSTTSLPSSSIDTLSKPSSHTSASWTDGTPRNTAVLAVTNSPRSLQMHILIPNRFCSGNIIESMLHFSSHAFGLHHLHTAFWFDMLRASDVGWRTCCQLCRKSCASLTESSRSASSQIFLFRLFHKHSIVTKSLFWCISEISSNWNMIDDGIWSKFRMSSVHPYATSTYPLIKSHHSAFSQIWTALLHPLIGVPLILKTMVTKRGTTRTLYPFSHQTLSRW